MNRLEILLLVEYKEYKATVKQRVFDEKSKVQAWVHKKLRREVKTKTPKSILARHPELQILLCMLLIVKFFFTSVLRCEETEC